MKRISVSLILGILTMSCGLVSTFAPPTSTPQPTPTFTAIPPTITPTPNPGSLTFPDVSDARISEDPESVVLLKEISLQEIPAFQDAKDSVFDFQHKKVAVEKDGLVEVWGFEDGALHLIHSLELPGGNVYKMSFSPTGSKLIVPWLDESYNTMLQLWDTNSWTSMDLGSVREDAVSVSFSPDETQLAVSGSPLVDREGTIELWDTNTGELIKTLPPLQINDALARDTSILMAYSPDGTKIASTYAEPGSPGIELWDLNKGKRIVALDEVGGTPNIVFSPDGRFLASTMDVGGNIKKRVMILWDAGTGKKMKDVELKNMSFALQPGAMVFSPDGRQLAVADEGLIHLLDLDTFNIRQTLESAGVEDYFSDVEYLMDGRLCVSVGSGKIQFWGIP